jgi:hypothetical protein
MQNEQSQKPLLKGANMKRQTKYYVSERVNDALGRRWHRLTKYYATELEATNELRRLARHYPDLAVRRLLPNYKRQTIFSIHTQVA